MGDIDYDLGFVLNQRRRKRAPFTGPQEGVVVSADEHGVRFAIPSFHPHWAFGPARWSHPTGGDDFPPAGTHCLVAFSGDDLSSPWVLAVDGWAPGAGSTAYSDERARDALGKALVGGTGIQITVDDAGDHITITASSDPGGGGTPPPPPPPPPDDPGGGVWAGSARLAAFASVVVTGAVVPVTTPGGPAAKPTVSAGPDVHIAPGSAFVYNAIENPNGSPIASRGWSIVDGPLGAGTTINTTAALSWVAGSSTPGSLDVRQPLFTELAYEITSTAENSTTNWQSAYNYIQDINDGRGYTGGIIGFCSGTGDMEVLVQHYTDIAPGNILAKYLPKLAQVMAAPYADRPNQSHSLLGAPFLADWKAAADSDPKFREAQRDERARVYFNPVMKEVLADGVGPLGLVLHYDVLVNHGPGSDSQSYGGIIAAARSSSSPPPSQGGSEVAYLTKICDLRDDVLRAWGDFQADGRSGIFRSLIAAGKLTLQTPLTWSVYGDTFTISQPPATPTDTAVGDYVLRFTATNGVGTNFDDVRVTVS